MRLKAGKGPSLFQGQASGAWFASCITCAAFFTCRPAFRLPRERLCYAGIMSRSAPGRMSDMVPGFLPAGCCFLVPWSPRPPFLVLAGTAARGLPLSRGSTAKVRYVTQVFLLKYQKSAQSDKKRLISNQKLRKWLTGISRRQRKSYTKASAGSRFHVTASAAASGRFPAYRRKSHKNGPKIVSMPSMMFYTSAGL